MRKSVKQITSQIETANRERRTLEGDVEHLEQRIDQAVFQLYGVDGLPT